MHPGSGFFANAKLFYLLPWFALCPLATMAQNDGVGSGRAVRFDGIDNYVDLGNVYDDVTLPLTVSAWVFVEPNSQYLLPILVSQDNAPLYNGFWFCLSQTNLFFEYGDGRGEQNSAFRRGKSSPVQNLTNRWIHISAVVKGANDIELYANGHNVGGSYVGSSSLPMASNYPGDVAKVGYLYTNSVTHRFKGMIDEIRLWTRALSPNEIRQTMCRHLKGDEPGLIGYWNFDETGGDIVKDLSPSRYDGILKGNPERVFSGAPIGDESVFLYTNSWTGKSLSKDNLTVDNVSSNAYGVHIYSVPHVPSQTGGLNLTEIQTPYYGVFIADDSQANTFDLNFAANNICSYYERTDNSKSHWTSSRMFSGISHRIEIIPAAEGSPLKVSLGEDLTRCDESAYFLETNTDPVGKTFRWNSGATTPGITVTASGTYAVEVSQGCLVDKDTITVSFVSSPPDFSLGENEQLCTMEPRTLSPDLKNSNYTFTWQDGSGGQSFPVTDFGTYWLKVENECGHAVDSVTFIQKNFQDIEKYNFITPDNQDMLNQHFSLDAKLLGSHIAVFNRWGKLVFESVDYQNNWDGNGLPAGVYYYTVRGDCFDPLKGTLTIMR